MSPEFAKKICLALSTLVEEHNISDPSWPITVSGCVIKDNGIYHSRDHAFGPYLQKAFEYEECYSKVVILGYFMTSGYEASRECYGDIGKIKI